MTNMDLALIRLALDAELRLNDSPAKAMLESVYDKIVDECARRAK